MTARKGATVGLGLPVSRGVSPGPSGKLARTYLDTARAIILVLAPNGTVQYINKKGSEVLGYLPEELIGKNWIRACVPKRLRRDIESAFATLLSGDIEDVEGYENPVVTKSGEEKLVAWSSALIRNVGGNVIAAVSSGEDITERKRAEREAQAKQAALVAQNRTISNFLNVLEITANSFNFKESLHRLLPHAVRLLEASGCLVYLINNEDQDIELHHSRLSEEILVPFLSSMHSYGDVTGMPVFRGAENQFISVEETRPLPRSFRYMPDVLERLDARHALLMPLLAEKAPVALLIFPKSAPFSRADKNMAAKLRKHLESTYISCHYAEALLRKTLTFTQQLEVISAMSGIDRAILSSTTREEITHGALKLFGRVVACNTVEILNYDSDRGKFALVASHAEDEAQTAFDMTDAFGEDQIASWTNIMFGIPVYFSDLQAEPPDKEYETRFLEKGMRSLMIVPLVSRGELLGLMAVAHKLSAAYSVEQLEVTRRLGNQIAVALSKTALIGELQETLIGTVDSLVAALDAKSPWTQGHSSRVSGLSVTIGRALNLEEKDLYELRIAALFHDIGKIGTYDIVLDKKRKLTSKEYELIREHPRKTFDILSPIPRLRKMAEIAMHHHERWDGSGYPDRLAGEDIPYLSRIIGCADALDAMTTDRPYRKALTKEEVRQDFLDEAGRQFDPAIAAVVVDILGKEITSQKRPRAA